MDFRQAASILCQAERPDLADPVIGTEFSFAAERVVYKGVVRQQPDQRRKMPFRISGSSVQSFIPVSALFPLRRLMPLRLPLRLPLLLLRLRQPAVRKHL